MRLASLVAVALFGIAGLCANAQTPMHPHHHLHHALWELRDARKELKESKHDFGGHREKALVAVDAAIKSVDLILKNTGDNRSAPARGDLSAEYKNYKHHHHMHHAIHELRHAHRQLEESKHDFGGNRKAALHDIHEAIAQLELCLKHHKG